MKQIKAFIKFLLSHIYAYRFKRAIKSGKLNGQLLIIMYHRVLPKSDPRLENEEPGMYVTPQTLDMHLETLKNISELTHIENWLAKKHKNELADKLYCAITFDDGWADNYEFALPLLKKHEAPATVFLATDYIGTSTTFWPERLAALLNNFEQCKAALTDFFEPLGQTIDISKLKAKDKDYFAHLIDSAKTLTDGEIKQKLSEIESSAQLSTQTEMLSWEQVKELLNCNIKIGGHTRSHLRLNEKATEEQIAYEVQGCANDIEKHLNFKPTQFCYPNGDTSKLAMETVEGLFNIAVTTQRGLNQAAHSPLALKRVGVHEDATNKPATLRAALSKAI